MAQPDKSLNYIAEWMESVGLIQADLVKHLGWSKAKANAIWRRDQRINEDVLREVAPLVKAEPHELLLPPDRAHLLRHLQAILDAATPKPPEDPEASSPAKVTPLRRRTAG